MSEQNNTENTKNPTMKAGAEIIGSCPVCNSVFEEPVATNINHVCPNPQCAKTFCVIVSD